ncbi:hypothetical protein TMP248_150083 [Tenacibaculum maritimum]|uniref:DUF2927 domain-containing protein n=1 Tax=Tenacibaculum maritimum TaxID=107401 RepID=UPI0012E5EB07|nr:DUF2927 domain-containing protein [Tenacibaculum maritimum]CAA0177859.1 putative SH3 type 3 domain-containing protein [Tenacibaculum maritimum]CAA0178104.1 hypothetical protein TMP248_150083 [Tenacibaculum maritimum]
MVKLNRNSFFLVTTILVTSIFFFVIINKSSNYIPTAYEKELIDYFKEIALQSEYDDNPQKVIKWKEPMLLYVIKEKEFKPQMSVIKKAIDSINKLATDGFKIVLTEKKSNSNAILYLCNKQKVAELNQYFYKLLTKDIDYEISGLAYSEFITEKCIIDKTLIFINSEDSFNIQKSAILEEITQSLGLAFDSNKYPNSIFYKNKHEKEIRIKEYSQLDRDVVRLLYHTKMKPGLDSIQVEKVIKKILKSEKD